MSDNTEPTIEFRLTIPETIHEYVRALAQKERRSVHNQYIRLMEDWIRLNTTYPKYNWGDLPKE